MVYYKSEFHEEQTELLLEKFKIHTVTQDIEYGSFAYVVGATYKAKQIEKIIDEEGTIDITELYEIIGVYSNSERSMIRFAVQLYSSTLDDITLSEVMESLDDENSRVIKQAIELRF